MTNRKSIQTSLVTLLTTSLIALTMPAPAQSFDWIKNVKTSVPWTKNIVNAPPWTKNIIDDSNNTYTYIDSSTPINTESLEKIIDRFSQEELPKSNYILDYFKNKRPKNPTENVFTIQEAEQIRKYYDQFFPNNPQARYMLLCENLADFYGVDFNRTSMYLSQLYQESKFIPTEISRHKNTGEKIAYGTAQVTLGTAPTIGLPTTHMLDPVLNPSAGLAYMIKIQREQGDIKHNLLPSNTKITNLTPDAVNVMIGYNAGPGILKKKSLPDPGQTIPHVKKIDYRTPLFAKIVQEIREARGAIVFNRYQIPPKSKN